MEKDLESRQVDADINVNVRSSNIGYFVFVVVVVVSAFFVVTNLLAPSVSSSITSLETTSDMVFSLRRKGYGSPLSFFTDDSDLVVATTYKFLEKYDAIIEPYASTHLYFSSDENAGNYDYLFTVCKYDSKSDTTDMTDCEEGIYQQQSVKIACDPFEEYTVEVKKYFGDTLLDSSTILAVCIYVRREILSLFDSDLTDTLDAMYVLWNTSETDGQALYGDDFHRSTWFTEAHMFNAAQRDGDHIHEGQGFLTQHLKITNLFEKSMQAINPAISLPYWDYTAELGDISDSPVFTEDMFGSIRTAGSGVKTFTYANNSILDGAIPDGRWAFIKADKNTRFVNLTNGYSYLRGAWNTNPSPFVSRFVTNDPGLPSCSAFFDILLYTDQAQFFADVPYGPHATTHGGIGGVFGCDAMDSLLEAGLIKDDYSKRFLCKKWSILMKELYRADLITPKSDCSVTSLDSDGFSCGFVCNDDDSRRMMSAVKDLITSAYVPTDFDSWAGWKDFICEGDAHKVFSGDHLEAASPSDPSFWPIHPNVERLFQAKYFAGGFETDDWPTESSAICDKYSCYETHGGEKGEYSQCCYGHNIDDQMLNFVEGDVTSGYGATNLAIMSSANPTLVTYKMPYVYDDFSWSHCDEDFSAYILSGVR